MSFQSKAVFGIVADGEDASGDARVHGLHAAIQHLGEAGHIGDVFHRKARVPQRTRRAARGNQVDLKRVQPFGEENNSRFIGNAEERPSNLRHS